MSCNMQGGAFITPCVLVRAPVMQSLFYFLFLTEAVSNIVKFLGMQPCERSDKVPDNKNSHTLYLAGELGSHVSAGAAALRGCTELKIRAGACDVLTEPWVGCGWIHAVGFVFCKWRAAGIGSGRGALGGEAGMS